MKKTVIFALLLAGYSGAAFAQSDSTQPKKKNIFGQILEKVGGVASGGTSSNDEIANGLKDVAYVKVYLDGDFPAGFKRLEQATKDMLEEFSAYSGGKIEYEFINPSGNTDEKTKKEIQQQCCIAMT